MKLHRNSQKRIYIDDATYFITTNTRNRIPYFTNDYLCDLFITQLKIAKDIHNFELFGFVIIPDHIHLMIRPGNKSNISKIMFSIKRQFSRNVNRMIRDDEFGHTRDNKFDEGAQALGRLHVNNKIDGGINIGNHGQFKWQKSYHDHYIRNERDFQNHLNYINTNHIKHNLPRNYLYISYNFSKLIDL